MEEGFLNLDNIMSAEEISGFFGNDNEEIEEPADKETGEQDKENKATENEVNGENLFDGSSESVGGEGSSEETPLSKGANASSKSNFYASTMAALVGDGVFSNLSEEDVTGVTDAETFANAVEKEVNAKFDARQKRILDALNYGVNPSAIKQNEAIQHYLNSITEDTLSDDSEEAAGLRRSLISQDLQNRGYTKEQIDRKVNDIFENNKDVDEAIDALSSNKVYYSKAYETLVENAKAEKEEEDRRTLEVSKEIEDSILKDKNLLGGIIIDDATRKKIVANTMSPTYRDESTNTYYTAIQKYQKEHPADFVKNLGILFTLTNGFTDIEGLTKGKVKKEVKSHLKELEHTINNTSRNSDGSFNFTSGVSDDDSVMHAGWKIDI